MINTFFFFIRTLDTYECAFYVVYNTINNNEFPGLSLGSFIKSTCKKPPKKPLSNPKNTYQFDIPGLFLFVITVLL